MRIVSSSLPPSLPLSHRRTLVVVLPFDAFLCLQSPFIRANGISISVKSASFGRKEGRKKSFKEDLYGAVKMQESSLREKLQNSTSGKHDENSSYKK
jgi:hypothetical protein